MRNKELGFAENSKPKMSRKRRMAALASGVLAAAMLLTGTLAWVSINQQALNPVGAEHTWEGTVDNAGGRLHDHFEGSENWTSGQLNKDIFVENFLVEDVLEGGNEVGEDIFVRVRLTELFSTDNSAFDPVTDLGPQVFIPGNPVSEQFRDIVGWNMGGRTSYDPTTNFAVTGPEAEWSDIRGAATDPAHPANTAGTGGGENGASAGGSRTNMPNAVIFQMPGVAGDTFPVWDGSLGDFWIFDVDGWAYWANPVSAGTSTGLLLDNIYLVTPLTQYPDGHTGAEPGSTFFDYSIEVASNMATANTIEVAFAGASSAARVLMLRLSGEDYTLVDDGDEDTLRDAIADGGNVLIGSDFELSEAIVIPDGNDVTITGTGTLYVDGNYRHFMVQAGGTLTLAGHVVLTRAADYTGFGGGVQVVANVFSPMGGTPSGAFIMDGGVITNIAHENSAAVFLAGETFIMNDGQITGNVNVNGRGGGVLLIPSPHFSTSIGDFVMNGGIISSNNARTYGGGVVSAGGNVTLNGGDIINNSSQTSHGGGLAVSGGTFTINAGIRFSGNVAGAVPAEAIPNVGGGAIRVSGNTVVNMNGGEIRDNQAIDHGGGIDVVGTSVLNMYGGTISGNTSGSGGVRIGVNATGNVGANATIDDVIYRATP